MITAEEVERVRRLFAGKTDIELLRLGRDLVAIGASPRSAAAADVTLECLRRGLIR